MKESIVAGVDLGGTAIKAAIAERNGSILNEDSIPTDSHLGPEDVIHRIASLIKRLASQKNKTIDAIGIGIPGLVDIKAGVTKFLPNFPSQWREIPVAQLLTEKLKCPVRLLNDVRTATLAELRFGHGRETPDVSLAFFSLGTGVGGGIAIDGQLRLGLLGAAGEIGHQTIVANGLRCGCGNRGCLETLASGPAIAAEGIRLLRMGLAPTLHEIVSGNADQVTTKEMAIASKDDERIREAIVHAAEYIGIAAANVVTILHPDLIVLGGGVAEIGSLLTNTVQQVIRKRVGMFPADDIRVEISKLGEKAGLMGAIALATEKEI